LYHIGRIYGERVEDGQEKEDSDPFQALNRALLKIDCSVSIKVMSDNPRGGILVAVEMLEEEPHTLSICCFLRGVLESYIARQRVSNRLGKKDVIIGINDKCSYKL